MEIVFGFLIGSIVTSLFCAYTTDERYPNACSLELLMRSRERLKLERKEAAARAKQYVKDEAKLRKSAKSIVT